jgi:hypothetical protein
MKNLLRRLRNFTSREAANEQMNDHTGGWESVCIGIADFREETKKAAERYLDRPAGQYRSQL